MTSSLHCVFCRSGCAKRSDNLSTMMKHMTLLHCLYLYLQYTQSHATDEHSLMNCKERDEMGKYFRGTESKRLNQKTKVHRQNGNDSRNGAGNGQAELAIGKDE